jgi:transposase
MCKKERELQAAVDTLGHLLGLTMAPANARHRTRVSALAAAVPAVTSETVTLAYVDQGCTVPVLQADAVARSITFVVIAPLGVQQRFVWEPRRQVVERCFAQASRFRLLRPRLRTLTENASGPALCHICLPDAPSPACLGCATTLIRSGYPTTPVASRASFTSGLKDCAHAPASCSCISFSHSLGRASQAQTPRCRPRCSQ